MKRSHLLPPGQMSMLSITQFALVISLLMIISTCNGSPQTLRHAHYWNEAILRHINVSKASPAQDMDYIVFLNTTPLWLNQTLDHFSQEVSPKFPQRYFEFLGYFKAPHGPIFLIVCGESTCPGILNDYIAVLAKRLGAAIVTLEHRYYGYSYPFTDLSTQNLKYLNSKQALTDLAIFRNHYQDSINQRYKLSYKAQNPWFTFGGSYAGALSAWFRLKFPHLTRGSLASSAIVHAIEDYYAFDEQVGKSLGPACTRALQAVKTRVNQYMGKNATQLKAMFGATVIQEDADFLSLLADSTALAAQYGFQDILCRPLVRSFVSKKDVLVAFEYFVKNTIYAGFGVNPLDYNRAAMKNSRLAGPTSGSRLWTYQFCTEFGLLQAAPPSNSIRFAQLNSQYYLDLCSYIFGQGIRPNPDATNLYYGGDRIAGSRIIFTNGSQDPWRHASKQVSTAGEPALVIECKNCGHCVDLSGCPQFPFHPQGDASICKPRNQIDRARHVITEYIELWINN